VPFVVRCPFWLVPFALLVNPLNLEPRRDGEHGEELLS
jgi:hypothetical protein